MTRIRSTLARLAFTALFHVLGRTRRPGAVPATASTWREVPPETGPFEAY